MFSLSSLRPYFLKALAIGFCMSGLLFPVIISIKNIFLYTSLVLSIFCVPWGTVLKNLKEEPFIVSSLALFILLAFGTIYSHAGLSRAFAILSKYRCLLYPLILFPLFKAYPRLNIAFIQGLFYSILLLLLLTLYSFLRYCCLNLKSYHYPTFIAVNPICGSFVTALIAHLGLIYTCFHAKTLKAKCFYGCIALSASCIILFFQQQRTGYFAYFACFLCFFFSLYLRLKFPHRLIILLLCIPAILLLVKIKTLSRRIEACLDNVLTYKYQYIQTISFRKSPYTELIHYTANLVSKANYLNFLSNEATLIKPKASTPFKDNLFMRSLRYKAQYHFWSWHRIRHLVLEPKKPLMYKRNPLFKPYSSSMGERLAFWKNALPLIHQNPWLGWGTGSFASVWVKEQLSYLRQPASFQSPLGVPNPHNQFLMFLVETGFVGLGMFFVWIFTFLRSMWKKGWPYGSIGVAYVGAFMIGCWGDSLLFLNVTGNFFVILCSCLLTLPKGYFQGIFPKAFLKQSSMLP